MAKFLDGLTLDATEKLVFSDATEQATAAYTKAEVDTISGSLSAEIDSDIAAHESTYDHDTFTTEAYVDNAVSTLSGSLGGDLSTHTSDSTIHFTEASIDHTAIQNIGSNSHSAIDDHISSTANPHSVDATDILPDQTTHSGSYLTTNGSTLSWVATSDSQQSGVEAIGDASNTVAVTFDTELDDTNYSISTLIENTTDGDPAMFGKMVTVKATTGFTLKLSGLTDSANYKLNWLVRPY
jgi:hypothetical protein